jgi:hypothetical protein
MAAALVVAGCGSTVTGRSVAPSDRPSADDVRTDLLDPGKYPISAVPLPTASSTVAGVVFEGQRMADAVVVPSEVDATLRHLRVSNTGAVENAQALRADIGLSRANIVAKHRFIVGFSSARDSGSGPAPDTSLVNMVMRFPDRGAAVAAAAALAATDVTQRPTAIPRHVDASASAYVMGHGVIVESFTAHGPYVLYQWVQTKESVETATELVAKTLDLQGRRMDEFVPTDPSRIAGLSLGAKDLLTHTLPTTSEVFGASSGEYSARGALHFQVDPMDSAALFENAGVESVSLRETMVLAARDPASATNLAEELAAHASAAGATLIQGVAGLPNAKCVDAGTDSDQTQRRFHCFASAGRFAYETSSEQQDDARKKAAAQYLVLRQYHR